MQKQAPTLGRLFVMVGFALSCFGLLLFLWLAFGGAIPLAPKGYRFYTSFDTATQLAKEADVRISGVSVGKAKQAEVRGVVRDTGTVFDALTARDNELASLITNSNKVFQTTAQRDEDLK